MLDYYQPLRDVILVPSKFNFRNGWRYHGKKEPDKTSLSRLLVPTPQFLRHVVAIGLLSPKYETLEGSTTLQTSGFSV